MQRREYLGSAAAVTAGLAGCTGFLSDSPDEVVEQFYQALDEGDLETANSLIHSESPEGELDEDDASSFEDMDITVESTEVTDESDDVAEVTAEITVESEDDSRTSEVTLELRKEDGDWKLYE